MKPTKEQIESFAQEILKTLELPLNGVIQRLVESSATRHFGQEEPTEQALRETRIAVSKMSREEKDELYRKGIAIINSAEQPIPTKSVDEIVEKWREWNRYNADIRKAIKSAILEATAAETARADMAEDDLRLIGDMAVVDWDDTTVGKVDAIVKGVASKTYIDKVRNLYKRAQEAYELEIERDTLQRHLRELKAAGDELGVAILQMIEGLEDVPDAHNYQIASEINFSDLRTGTKALANWQEKTKGIE